MYQYKCLNPIAACGLEIFDDQYIAAEDIKQADAVLVRSAAMHEMTDLDKLVAVARAGAGVNNIPVEEYTKQGIAVFNTPGANANGVKELVIAGMLMASRDLLGGNHWVDENQDDPTITKDMEKAKKAYAGTEIQGKKLGVIGLGAIGVKVANVARDLGMEVYGYDPFLSIKSAWNLSRGVKHVSDVTEIYKECDYITIHVPLLDSTKNMINAEAIDMMKDTTTILNFARNGLVDDEAVVAALKDEKIRHYVTDFPTPIVAGVDGVIAFPHLGASTEESEDNCAVMAVEQLREYMENGNIKNSVNLPAIDMGVCETDARISVIHKNIPNMLTQFTGIFSKDGINISGMSNKTRGEYGYALFDIDGKADDNVVKELESIDGVLKARVIK